jgi:hypothetical protein
MSDQLERLAKRLENDAYFLACPLKRYAEFENLGVDELARGLACSLETLTLIRLCRAPRSVPAEFRQDIAQVATRFHVDADILASMVRSGQAIYHMGQAASQTGGTLMAARDADSPEEDKSGGDET